MTKRRKTSDGRVMTQPELRINEGSLSPDTIFTVSGTSPWGSTSKYNVVLNGPDSYYTYKASQLETDENGDEIRSWVTKTGNDPQRLARYRAYVKEGEQANDYTSVWEDLLRAIGIKKKDGGWLTKFQNGGSTQPTQDQVMKELMAIVQQAATELQANKPGQGVQTLAQIANDPQGSQLLDTLVQQVPEAGSIVEAVMKMVGAFKCGGKTKKKVKKGAKGCVPCKKLMRVGGKLINVLTDCEGNIISKHQVGGWIRKGYEGLKIGDTTIGGFSADHLLTLDQIKATQGVQNGTTRHYYDPTDNLVKQIKYENGAWGNPETFTLEDGQTFGTGTGQINLWEDGYNLETGVMPGMQIKRTYKSGAEEMLNSRVKTDDPVQFNAKATPGQTNAGYSMDPNRNVTLNYTVAEKARNLRNRRRADYWANRMAGNSIAVSAKERRHQRRMDQNAVYGWHANQDADFFGQKEGFVPIGAQGNEGNSYKTFYNAHKNYTKNTSKVTTPNEGDVEISASTPSPTNIAPAKLIKAQQRHKQGGWLTKFQDGGLAYPKAETMYFDPQTRSRQVITNKKLEGKQLPAGTIITQTTGDRMKGFPSQVVESYVSNPANYIYERQIKYGATPAQNDTVYTTRFVGRPMPQMSEQARSKFNNEYYKQ